MKRLKRVQVKRTETRTCEVCGQGFTCRADNATYTCGRACASIACWNQRRLRGT